MTARAFLTRGLLAGLVAGFATFLVAHQLGEPQVETAVALEAPAHHDTNGHDTDGHDTTTPEEDGAIVSRQNQRTWGLLTGTLAVGTALGGLVALVSAVAVGRVGRLGAASATVLVAVAGFVSVALVPFLKYPANPPSVGNAETIGDRTQDYFAFLLVSLVAAVAGTALATRLWHRLGTYAAVLLGAGTYTVVVATVGGLMPTVNEVGSFPADTLWYFRRASLLTLAVLWAAIGVVLSGLVGRLEQRETEAALRRELAAAL